MPSERLAQEAAALEHDAEEYPDQRGEILLEASTAWRRAGDDSRADQLLESLVEAGGEDAAYARVELASNAFDEGNRAAAAVWLDSLAKDPALHDGHCQLVAELLASHGDTVAPPVEGHGRPPVTAKDRAQQPANPSSHRNAVARMPTSTRRTRSGLAPVRVRGTRQDPAQVNRYTNQ